ncbi:replicase [Wenling hepe-like virus 1]|uniref:replicase n=1 Tax=Wenling hepe-like virus 1 TaxID=1923493 RepID=UPI00090B1F08|nr:replicase [Wenling hepe-like virus 1]APG77823.1 replicase [Wenling hepe-like virus 1]
MQGGPFEEAAGLRPVDGKVTSVTSAINAKGADSRQLLNEYHSSELDKRLVSAVELPFIVSPPTLDTMNEIFSPIVLRPSKSAVTNNVTNAHPFAAATTHLMQLELDRYNGPEFGGKISCRMDHGMLENDDQDKKHVTCLKSDAKDDQRVIKALTLSERGSRLPQFLTQSGCVNGAENCKQPAKFLKCNNVLFWLTIKELFQLFKSRGTMRLLAGMLFPKGIETGETTTDYENRIHLSIDKVKNTAVMSFLDDNSLPYCHSLDTWQNYSRSGIIDGRKYDCNFNLLIERTKSFGIGSIVDITRVQRGLDITVGVKTTTTTVKLRNFVTMLPQLAKYGDEIDTCVGEISANFLELRRITSFFEKMPIICVPEALLTKLEQFLFNRKDADIDRGHVGAYLSAVLHEVTISHYQIQKGNLLDLTTFTDLCIVILIRSFIARSKASKSISFAALNITKKSNSSFKSFCMSVESVFNDLKAFHAYRSQGKEEKKKRPKRPDPYNQRRDLKTFAKKVMEHNLKAELVRKMIIEHEKTAYDVFKSVAKTHNLLHDFPTSRVLTFDSPTTGLCYQKVVTKLGILSQLKPFPTRGEIDAELAEYEDEFDIDFTDGHATLKVQSHDLCEHLVSMKNYNILPEPSDKHIDMQHYYNKKLYSSVTDNTNYEKTALALTLLQPTIFEKLHNLAASPMNDAGLWANYHGKVVHWFNTKLNDALLPVPPIKQTIKFNKNVLCADCLKEVDGPIYLDLGAEISHKYLPFMQLTVLQQLIATKQRFVMKWQDFVGTMENSRTYSKFGNTTIYDTLKKHYVYYSSCLSPGEVYVTNFDVTKLYTKNASVLASQTPLGRVLESWNINLRSKHPVLNTKYSLSQKYIDDFEIVQFSDFNFIYKLEKNETPRFKDASTQTTKPEYTITPTITTELQSTTDSDFSDATSYTTTESSGSSDWTTSSLESFDVDDWEVEEEKEFDFPVTFAEEQQPPPPPSIEPPSDTETNTTEDSETSTSMNYSVEMVFGNIVDFEADYWVNSAKETLEGGGGIDGAIHRAAGTTALKLANKGKYIVPGQVTVTSGFKSKAKQIIHTVAPRVNDEELYRKSVESALNQVAQGKMVYLPYLGSGIFGLNKEMCKNLTTQIATEKAKERKIHIRVIDLPYVKKDALEIPKQKAKLERKGALSDEIYDFLCGEMRGDIPRKCDRDNKFDFPTFLNGHIPITHETLRFGGVIKSNKIFSNYAKTIVYNGDTSYPHNEGFYQHVLKSSYAKGITLKAATNPNPQVVKKAAEGNPMCCHEDAIIVMAKAVESKFSRERLWKQLEQTNPKMLVEVSAKDRFWASSYTGMGCNVLGKLLTLYRENTMFEEEEEVEEKKEEVKLEPPQQEALQTIQEEEIDPQEEEAKQRAFVAKKQECTIETLSIRYYDATCARPENDLTYKDCYPEPNTKYVLSCDAHAFDKNEFMEQGKVLVFADSEHGKNLNMPFDGVSRAIVNGKLCGVVYEQTTFEFTPAVITFPHKPEAIKRWERELRTERQAEFKQVHKACAEFIKETTFKYTGNVHVMEGTYGSGKTFQLMKLIREKQQNKNYMVVTPTSALAQEYKHKKFNACSWSTGLRNLYDMDELPKGFTIYIDEAYLIDPKVIHVLFSHAYKVYMIGDSRQLQPGDGKKILDYPLLEEMLNVKPIKIMIAQKTPLDVVSTLNAYEPQKTVTRSKIINSINIVRVDNFSQVPKICKPKCELAHECCRGAVFDSYHAKCNGIQTVAQIQGCRYNNFNLLLTSNSGQLINRAHGQKLVSISRHVEKLTLYESRDAQLHNKFGFIKPMLDKTIIAGRNDVPTIFGAYDLNDVKYREPSGVEANKVKISKQTTPTDFASAKGVTRLAMQRDIKEKVGREVTLTIPTVTQVQAAVHDFPHFPVSTITDNSEEIRVEMDFEQNMLEKGTFTKILGMHPDAPAIDHLIKKVSPTNAPLASGMRDINIATMREIDESKMLKFKNHTALFQEKQGTTIAGLASMFGHVQKNITPDHSINTAIERAASKPKKVDGPEVRSRAKALINGVSKFLDLDKLKPPTLEEFALCRAQAEMRVAAKRTQPEPSMYGDLHSTTAAIKCFNKQQMKSKVGENSWLTTKEDDLGLYIKGGQMVSAQSKNVNQITAGWVNWAERIVFSSLSPYVVPGYGRSPRTFRRKVLNIIKQHREEFECKSIDLSEQDTIKDGATNLLMREIYARCGVPSHIMDILESPNHNWRMKTLFSETSLKYHFQSGRMDTLFSNTIHVLAEVGKSYDIYDPILVLAQGDDVYIRASSIRKTLDFTPQIKEDNNQIGDFIGFLIGKDEVFPDLPRIAQKHVSKSHDTKERREELRVAIKDLMSCFSTNVCYYQNMLYSVAYKYNLTTADVAIFYDYLEHQAVDDSPFKEKQNLDRLILTAIPVYFETQRAQL